jgi:hypothetical protein
MSVWYVIAGLSAEYKLTNHGDFMWTAERVNERGEIVFKDGVVISKSLELAPESTGDAVAVLQEPFKALYFHAHPTTEDLDIRHDAAQIEVAQLNPMLDMQRISFVLSDYTVYRILITKDQKSNRRAVLLEQVWY